ncbi:MAG: lectin-like domain-containing protein [Parvicellaceae bacterium]
MKNVFKYFLILLFLSFLGGHSYSQTQCDDSPVFILNGDARFNSSCTGCTHIDATVPNNGELSTLDPNEYRLTRDSQLMGGAAWNSIGIDLSFYFEINLQLYFGTKNVNGADGIAFVLQTDPNGTSSGGVGGGMGYSGNPDASPPTGIRPSIAVEFDGHRNYSNNPNAPGSDESHTSTSNDHVAVQKDGRGRHVIDDPTPGNGYMRSEEMLYPLTGDAPLSISNVQYSTGKYLDFRFTWDPDPDNDPNTLDGEYNVWLDIDNNGIFDGNDHVVDNFEFDLIDYFDQTRGNTIVYWGLTAAGGDYFNEHKFRYVNSSITVDFNYDASLYCHGGTNPVPIISGLNFGTFSATSGLIFVDTGTNTGSNTGEIDLTNSTPGGPYTITYTIDAGCIVQKNNLITIDEDPDFTYSKYSFCESESNPLPISFTPSGGTFSSSNPSNCSVNITTGEIDLANSTAGMYDIIYTSPTCSITKVRSITIDSSPNVDAGVDLDVCDDGSQITLTATGASSYVWYSSLDPNFNNPNFINNGVPFSWSWSGNTYTFVVVGTGPTGCTATDEVTVTLLDQPNAYAGVNQSNICVGTPVTMAGSVNGGVVSSTNWTTSGDGSFDVPSSLTAIYSPGPTDNLALAPVTLTLQANPLPPCTVADSDNMTVTFTTTVSNNSVAISPSSPTPNDDLTANINSTCVDVSSNDWRLNGTSIAPLNFPFNTSGTSGLTSKSTNPEVLSISGASPIISQGISGNCFEFTSQGELEANISTLSPSNGISISVWTYTYNQSSNFRRWVSLNSSSGTELLLRKSFTNSVEAVVWAGGSTNYPNDFILESGQVQNEAWEHWVLTYDNNNTMILYKNGDEEIFNTTTIGQGINDITQIKINTNSSGGWYNGKLDEVMVFDRELTPEQATALYNNGDPDYEKIVKEETNCGETWTLNSTPYNHIGSEGTATLSSAVSIPAVSISTQPSSGADVCQGTTASTMTVVASSGSGNYTYQWYTCQSDGSNPVIISGETNTSFTPPTSSPGTIYYIVTVTDQDANCGSETSNVVSQTVDESITVAAGGDQTVCGNVVVNITGTITGGVSNGTWSASAAGTFGNTTDLSTTFTPGASLLGGGTVDLTLTSAANGACPAVTDQLTLTINSADAGFSYVYSEYCSDETNPIPTITGDVGAFSSTTGLVINSTTGEIDLTGSTAGTYTVTYTLTGACPNSSTFDVTITTPTVGFNYGGQTSFCLGTTPPSVTYTAPTGGVFSSDNVNIIVDPNTGEIDLVNSLPGSYMKLLTIILQQIKWELILLVIL